MFPAGNALLIVLTLSLPQGAADARQALERARAHEASLLSRTSTRTCRRLASLDALSWQQPQLEVIERIAIAPPNGPERIETARLRFTLGAGIVRESLDEQLAASVDDDDGAARVLASPETWTSGLCLALARRAVRLTNESRTADAVRLAQLADRIASEIGDLAGLSQAYGVRSILARVNQAPKDLARSLAEEAVALAEETGDPDVLAPALLRLGRADDRLLPDSAPFFRIVNMAGDIEDATIPALAASQLARYFDMRGKYRRAFELTSLALRFAEKSGSATARVSAGLNLAGAYNQQGDFDLAAEHWLHTAEVALEAGLIESAATALRFAGSAEARRGNSEAALAATSRAIDLLLPLSQSPEIPATLAGIFRARAEIFLRDGRLDEAEQAVGEAIALAGPEDHQGLLAALLLARGQSEKAIEVGRRSWNPAKQPPPMEDRLTEARAWRALSRNETAIALLRDLICETEQTRGSVLPDPRQRWLFLERYINLYRELLEILVETGDYEGALQIAELMKGRALAESIGSGAGDIRGAEAKRLDASIRQLNAALQSGRGDAEELRKELVQARMSLADLNARATVTLESPPPRHDPAVAASPAAGSTLILEYAATSHYYVLFTIVRRGDGDEIAGVHRIDTAASRRNVAEVVGAVRQRNLRFNEYARPLYDLLIGPAAALVRDASAICIIPDGELWSVPFQALLSGDGRYLVEQAPVFFAPSLATLDRAALRRGGAPSTVMAFATSIAEEEVDAIEALYGHKASSVLRGADAREAAFKAEGGRFDVLHFATHAVADEAQPLFSSLLLSPDDGGDDGVLEAREIAALDLRASVAVLSACSTGRGRVHAGEGVIGLSWAFLAAGCARTVVSQWDTSSSATTVLMREFHRRLRDGRSVSQAMREAALAVRAMPRYRHPFYWASFVTIGAP